MRSLRERALAGNNPRSEIVTVPDWADGDENGDVKLVGLTAGQRLRLVKRATVSDTVDGKTEERVDNALLYPLLIIESAHDPATGQKMFTDGDADLIMGNNAGVIEGIATVVLRLSGMTKDAQTVVSKNSAPTPSAATASA